MADQQTTQGLLARSAQQYADLQQQAETLLQILASMSGHRVREQVALLDEKQQAASELDEDLLPRIKEDLPAWQGHPLYQQRLRAIEAIVELNKLILPKIRGMMAVSSAELEQLRSGRVTLAGYAPQAGDQRGLRGVG